MLRLGRRPARAAARAHAALLHLAAPTAAIAAAAAVAVAAQQRKAERRLERLVAGGAIPAEDDEGGAAVLVLRSERQHAEPARHQRWTAAGWGGAKRRGVCAPRAHRRSCSL